MIGFYQITQALNDELKNANFKTVTFGDVTEVDLKRQTIYPLCHIVPASVTDGGNINTFTFELIGMDLVDFNKNDVDDIQIPFYGIDNRQDILHDILGKMQLALEQFERGDWWSKLMRMETGSGYDPFMERFENVLAGWAITISIQVPKTPTIC